MGEIRIDASNGLSEIAIGVTALFERTTRLAKDLGMDSRFIHGTFVIGYHADKGCSGHEIARLTSL